ncbi:MAG: DUF6079 family protein [Armatimonadota bacterium]
MVDLPLERLACIRRFPPVVHPRHARELLAAGEGADLSAWTGGYAITIPEHRRLLEDLLGSLAWKETGQAVLVNGLYGTGKSHLLVLLHLLTVLPAAWPAFLQAHPAFKRYETPMSNHRRLVIHFSLDEYGPQQSLERAVYREVLRSLHTADSVLPETPSSDHSRLDTWAAVMEGCKGQGYDGIVLLVDEVSLFLAGKSPAKREADAAFLQFLAGWTNRAPLWLIGALQRHLSDVGALRTHSWRQVEDRFQRYTLSPQQIGHVLRDKLVQRIDPAAVRALVAEEIMPAAEAQHLALSAGELQQCWPFHPRALDLLIAITGGYLSPHRSAVELLQQLDGPDWRSRPARQLITPLDLFRLAEDDLRGNEQLTRLWNAIDLLDGCAAHTGDPALAQQAIRLLAMLHLAEQPATVSQLQSFFFDGYSTPTVDQLSSLLHSLRRYGAYLAVERNAEPAAEVFCLAIEDEVGALARARMQELRQEFIPHDPRVIEAAFTACNDPVWPLAPALEGMRIDTPWCGSDRAVLITASPSLSVETITRTFEGLLAGHAAGQVIFAWPGMPAKECWQQTTAAFTGPEMAAFLLWSPRPATTEEWSLWSEYAAWQRAAGEAATATTPREKRIRLRCRERADELHGAVVMSMRRLYQDGRWTDARGHEGVPPDCSTLADCLAGMLAPGFEALFPLFPLLTTGGVPPRPAVQQLLTQVIDPGEAFLPPQSLLGEYLERFMQPLGCVTFDGSAVHVSPPRWEVLEPLLALLGNGPIRVQQAHETLQQPPLGLTAGQTQLAIASAARCGVIQPLDSFLQPLNITQFSLSRSDALAFIGPPVQVHQRHAPAIHTLAARWGLPADPWAVACSQVERKLRETMGMWMARIPEIRSVMAVWSELCDVPPWAWQHTERLLSVHEQAGQLPPDAFDEVLTALGEGIAAHFDAFDDLWHAVCWWQTHHRALTRLLAIPPGSGLQDDLQAIYSQLAAGEAAFSALPAIGERIAALRASHHDLYLRWHTAAFGSEVITALREAFDQVDFRAVKRLTLLPLPVPEPASLCLEALAHARTAYCPGIFTNLAEEGCCAHCRLPLGSPSPMPNPADINRWTAEALHAYAELLPAHPWIEQIRRRLPRAPEQIATHAQAFLAWQEDDGAQGLVEVLDDALISWLCRDRHTAGTRRVGLLTDRLHGRELTVTEVRSTVLDWLDPEQQLKEEDVLVFE